VIGLVPQPIETASECAPTEFGDKYQEDHFGKRLYPTRTPRLSQILCRENPTPKTIFDSRSDRVEPTTIPHNSIAVKSAKRDRSDQSSTAATRRDATRRDTLNTYPYFIIR
jgi:hypothetical protein